MKTCSKTINPIWTRITQNIKGSKDFYTTETGYIKNKGNKLELSGVKLRAAGVETCKVMWH